MTRGGEPSSTAAPIGQDELDRIFAPLLSYRRAALAVSGGADSLALMVLAEEWRRRQAAPPDLAVLTVDHGLRAEAAGEAAWVKLQAAKLGLEHETLAWSGPKPRSGLQAAARAARYGLMLDYCRKAGCDALVTAHTAEDQAETLLMRLARGSGLDGLAAASPASVREGVSLLRVLLDVERARLEASLRARGLTWIEDPGNRDPRYERVRLREALRTGRSAGLTAGKLALSAKRLARARTALEEATNSFLKVALQVYPAGYGELKLAALREAPEEIALRALARMAAAFGGGQRVVRLARLEALHETLCASPPHAATLGGCVFMAQRDIVRVLREFGRIAPERLPLPPGAAMRWDGRFQISAPPDAANKLSVGALGPQGLRKLRAMGGRAGIPARAAHALPGVWEEDALLYAPFAVFPKGEAGGWRAGFQAVFTGGTMLLGSAADRPPGEA